MMCVWHVIAVTFLMSLVLATTDTTHSKQFLELYQLAVNSVYVGDFQTCSKYLHKALLESPLDINANQLLGLSGVDISSFHT